MSSNPLVVSDETTLGQTGMHVFIGCREPAPCMSGKLHGPSAVINRAIQRLEAIHQAAHAIDDDREGT